MARRKFSGTVIVTYRCNARCNMCDCWKHPSVSAEELGLDIIRKLPPMAFTNITGGEPFIRQDLPDIVAELQGRTERIVISTNGYFADRILDLCKQFPKVGIRISIEGLQATNDAIRGIPDGFERGYGVLRSLAEAGHRDIGFGMTVQDANSQDLVPLYQLGEEMRLEFATAALHNSFYFRKTDNHISDPDQVSRAFAELINLLLKSNSPKKWGRAYFNYGLINYIWGNPRLLPCQMGTDAFFVDPSGQVLPCNGSAQPLVMGDLNHQTFEELWDSAQAEAVRRQVEHCQRGCWMIGSASPAIQKHLVKSGLWALQHKLAPGHFVFRAEDFNPARRR